MHGGVKVYRGTAAAARNYVNGDRSRTVGLQIPAGTGRNPWYTFTPPCITNNLQRIPTHLLTAAKGDALPYQYW